MRKVLIVEDEAIVRRMLHRFVTSLGYDVREAEDGRAVLAQCEAWKPDVIFLDIFMPEKDGLETIRALRKTRPGIPIIAMSGGGNIGDMNVLQTARAMGVAKTLAKPIGMHDLEQALAEVMTETEIERTDSAAVREP